MKLEPTNLLWLCPHLGRRLRHRARLWKPIRRKSVGWSLMMDEAGLRLFAKNTFEVVVVAAETIDFGSGEDSEVDPLQKT